MVIFHGYVKQPESNSWGALDDTTSIPWWRKWMKMMINHWDPVLNLLHEGFLVPVSWCKAPFCGEPRGPICMAGTWKSTSPENAHKTCFSGNPSSNLTHLRSSSPGVGCGFLIWSVFHGFPLITSPVVVDTDSSCWLSSHAVGRRFENLPLQVHKFGESSTQCASQV